jgi:hypothetical protein
MALCQSRAGTPFGGGGTSFSGEGSGTSPAQSEKRDVSLTPTFYAPHETQRKRCFTDAHSCDQPDASKIVMTRSTGTVTCRLQARQER